MGLPAYSPTATVCLSKGSLLHLAATDLPGHSRLLLPAATLRERGLAKQAPHTHKSCARSHSWGLTGGSTIRWLRAPLLHRVPSSPRVGVAWPDCPERPPAHEQLPDVSGDDLPFGNGDRAWRGMHRHPALRLDVGEAVANGQPPLAAIGASAGLDVGPNLLDAGDGLLSPLDSYRPG